MVVAGLGPLYLKAVNDAGFDLVQPTEPPRVSWRLLLLRGWSHEQSKQVFPGSA